MIRKEIKSWINSLSGFQGGNPEAEIWVCGLEYQSAEIPGKIWTIENPPFVENDDIYENEHKEKFNESIRRLLQGYYGINMESPKNIFAKDGKVFKLNLYPLNQKKTSEEYDLRIFEKTNIKNKSELRNICMDKDGRFDNFKNLMERNKETLKVIVCCSRNAMESYILAFVPEEERDKRRQELETRHQIGDHKVFKKFYSFCRLESGVFLFVTPFLSGWFTSLNKLCEPMGEIIRKEVYKKNEE